jgi:TRAP-type mannitol/chloroaromatic compound transport system permease small subunit
MDTLLRLSRIIDAVSRFFGKFIIWLVLAAAVISASNAVARKAFNVGSNAFLEIQWYLFGAVFLLGAGYTFLQNAHVRIDVVAGKLSMRVRTYIDIVGILVFLLPMCWFMIEFAWPVVAGAYASGEMSSNAGGLIRWPVYALVPAGFALLGLQAVSELIKRLAFLQGKAPNPLLEGGHDGNADSPAQPQLDATEEVQK